MDANIVYQEIATDNTLNTSYLNSRVNETIIINDFVMAAASKIIDINKALNGTSNF